MRAEEVAASMVIGGAVGVATRMGLRTLLGPAGTVAGMYEVTRKYQEFEFDGFVRLCGEARTSGDLDKAAQYAGQAVGRMVKEGVLGVAGGAGALSGRALTTPLLMSQADEVLGRGVAEFKEAFGGRLGEPVADGGPSFHEIPERAPQISEADELNFYSKANKKGVNGGSGARGAKFEDEALARVRAEHPYGFKPDAEAQRLGYTNLKAADWVGLQEVKGGKYIAHVSELTVKHKSLSEIGKQLDGAQKITSAKLGERINRYEYYIRTNNKQLADEIRHNRNQIPKPGGKKGDSFRVTVVFEGGIKR